MTDAANSAPRVRYEVANALGRLWQVRPKLAQRCDSLVSYARAIRLLLNAVDLYCQAYGIKDPRDIARLRIECRTKPDGVRFAVHGP